MAKGSVPAALKKFQFKKGGGRVGTTKATASTKKGTKAAGTKKSTKK